MPPKKSCKAKPKAKAKAKAKAKHPELPVLKHKDQDLISGLDRLQNPYGIWIPPSDDAINACFKRSVYIRTYDPYSKDFFIQAYT
jgi:hypothetical protein